MASRKVSISLDRGTDWAKAAEALGLAQKIGEATQKAVLQEAHYLRGKVLEGFSTEAPAGRRWVALSPITLAVRKLRGQRGTKILQVSADMRNSVSVIPMDGGGAFIGVARTKTRKDGKDPVNIAIVQEEGATIRQKLSPAARRFLFMALAKAGLERPHEAAGAQQPGGRTVTIRIPPRPFLGPIFDAYGQPQQVLESITARLLQLLGGALGKAEGAKPRE